MTYSEVQEKLILTNKIKQELSFLEMEFPYQESYELLNIAIIKAAKSGETHINFDYCSSDLSKIKDISLAEVERNVRNIYPSYDSGTHALKETFNYPRYLAARGFDIEIKDALKSHGYVSKSYHITWGNK